MKKAKTIAWVTALLMSTASADDRSTQAMAAEDAQLSSDYHRLIALVLKEAFEPDVTLRAVITNPLMTEFAVGVRDRKNARPEIFMIESPSRLFTYAELDLEKSQPVPDAIQIAEMQKEGPLDPSDIRVRRVCTHPIPTALATDLKSVWTGMLQKVPPLGPAQQSYVDANGHEVLTMDASTFEFSAAGQTASIYDANVNPDAAILLELTVKLSDLCRTHSKDDSAAVNQLATQLLHRLKQENRK